MIDCLSNPSWINPQIDVLLFLQNFRIGNLEGFDKFFLSITVFGEYWVPALVCAITYWCIDFKAGMYLFSLYGFNSIVAHLFKMIACVYRPWVLDAKIHPSELAVPYAKGYSFPSGHSAMSSSTFGGVAYLLRQKKFICILLICLILTIGFSRLWLGVHTPQDVVGGFIIGIILVFLVNKLLNWAEENKNRYWYLFLFVNLFAALSIVYICFFATYRMDYADGMLLVNPVKSIYNTATVYGYSLGIMDGCLLCRIFCPFNPKDSTVKSRFIRGLIGSVGIIVMLKYALKYIVMNPIPIRYAMIATFVIGIIVTLIYPILFTFCEKIKKD